MARLCLTSERGTLLHGMYRGLRIKTKDTQYHVVVHSTDLQSLRNDVELPVILYVKLTSKVNKQDPRYSEKWGWFVGINHTIVLFGFTEDGRVDIGDPGMGREYWDIKSLEDLWHGQYACLIY